jgi:hypothetical protein
VTAGRSTESVVIRPRRPLLRRGPVLERSWYLRSSYRTNSPTGLPIAADLGLGYPPRLDHSLPPRPHGGEALTELGSLPPPGPATLVEFRVDVPPGRRVCFGRLVVGSFVPY